MIESFESRPDKTAMRIVGDDSHIYTFGQMLRQVRSIAYRLRLENVAHGDRVALIGENHPAWAIAYLGTLVRGAVVVPLDPHGEIETITNFIENSEAKVAFISSDEVERFALVKKKLTRDIGAVVWEAEPPASAGGAGVDLSSASLPPAYAGGSAFIDWASTDFPDSFANEPPPAKGDDVAVLMYTSGTTGTPKGVPLTHNNILAELEGVNFVLKLSDKEKMLSLLPLFHAYLQIVNLWIATTYGCEVGYLKELTPAELSDAMKSFKPTILTTVPRLWYLFHKKIFDAVKAKPKSVQVLFNAMLWINGILRDAVHINLGRSFFGQVHESFGGHLRIAISGGSRFDEDVAMDFHRLGFTILQGYGLTETSGAATATYENDNRIGSVGHPMHGGEIKIADPDSEGVGEVLIKGPMVFKGYYQNPQATAEAFTADGWFRSGDLGRLDTDGHLYIVGRGKDVIVLPSGKNVHPEDLELHYLKCPLVAELAIIGVEENSGAPAGSEKLAAVGVPHFDYLKQTKVANSKEAIRHALDNLGRELPEYQRVRDYIIRAEPLPRTATNKIKRFQLKKEVETGVTSSTAKEEEKSWNFSADDNALLHTKTAKAVVAAILMQRPARSKGTDIIHPDMNLEIDLGLDSLARAEMFAALEQAFSTEFDGDEAATALTVANVIDLVQKHGGDSVEDISVDLNWGKILREADDDFPEVRGILKNRPLFSLFAFSVYKCFNLFFKLFTRLEVHGLENLKALVEFNDDKQIKKTFLICPNHQSFLDPFALCSTYPLALFRRVFHVGASEFFNNALMRFIAKMLNVVPVNPDTELMRAMKAGAIGLKNGKILNMYPEGERAFDGELHTFKKGAAILATELDLPIVPVAIDGLYKVWPRQSWRIRPAKVKIRIGKPFYPKDVLKELRMNDHEQMTGDEVYTAVTAHLKQTVAEMIADMRK